MGRAPNSSVPKGAISGASAPTGPPTSSIPQTFGPPQSFGLDRGARQPFPPTGTAPSIPEGARFGDPSSTVAPEQAPLIDGNAAQGLGDRENGTPLEQRQLLLEIQSLLQRFEAAQSGTAPVGASSTPPVELVTPTGPIDSASTPEADASRRAPPAAPNED